MGVAMVVVVVDRRADVVQHACGPEEVALLGHPVGVQTGVGQTVEDLARELRHVADVLAWRVEAVGEVPDRLGADVLEERGSPSRRSKKMPSRSPASDTSTLSKPPPRARRPA